MLRKRSYRLKKRGTIGVKGEGRVTTYLLLANENISDEALLGMNANKIHQQQSDDVMFG